MALLLMLTSMSTGGKVLEAFGAPPETWLYVAGSLLVYWLSLSAAASIKRNA